MALRWLWLPVLVAAAVVSLPAVFPQHDSFARALYDVQHQNSSVVYIEKLDPGKANGRVRVIWQTDRLSWHQADVPVIPSPDCDSMLMLEPMKVSDGGMTVTVYRGGRCWATTFDEAWQLTDAAAWYDLQLGPERHVERRTFSRPEIAGVPIDISRSTRAIQGLWVFAVAAVSSAVLVGTTRRCRRVDANRRAAPLR